MHRDTFFNCISRLMACLMVVALLVCVLPPVNAQAQSGQCGENLTWSFSAGALTLSGSGAMTDFSEDTMAPWYPLRNQILRLELPQGLSNVGNLAFYGCDKLLAVNIPDSVSSIGSYAFANCAALKDLGVRIFRLCQPGCSLSAGKSEHHWNEGLLSLRVDPRGYCTCRC